MKRKIEELKKEFARQKKEVYARKQYAERHPKSKEARTEHRKVGLLLFGLSVFFAAPQVLAYLFDDTYYPRLAIFTGVLAIVSLLVILTGRLPKLPPRR